MRTRREFVAGGVGAIAASGLVPGLALAAGARASRRRTGGAASLLSPSAEQLQALRVLGRTSLRLPGSVPHAALAAGTDTVPQIEHVVVVMMENHSYDNVFGMLGRMPGQRPRGDGFTIARDGYPSNSNPQPGGQRLRAFRMPTTCQLSGKPSQEWIASHEQYASGTNEGFVTSPSGPVAMGYWDHRDLPFTYSLGSTFPIGDRWFCSMLGQTDPNRRYLIAATSSGMTDDIPIPSQVATLSVTPPGGTIFTQLSAHGVSWADYYAQYPNPTAATPNLYPVADGTLEQAHGKSISQFLSDAAHGLLPSFSLVEPNYSKQSQENPQNLVVGEAFLAQIVNVIGHSPKWKQTILIITYDEHGGYYDHVPPPVALAPDGIPPIPAKPSDPTYDGFYRYGFRVPSIVVSPYAKRRHVSHVVYDHTSILAFVERKWNLPAMTMRDANANDLSDFLDLPAMAAGQPTFPRLPKLAHPGEDNKTLRCSTTGPGTVPPGNPRPAWVALRAMDSRSRGGVLVRVRSRQGQLGALRVELRRGSRVVSSRRIPELGGRAKEFVLRDGGHRPPPGRYTIVVRAGHELLARHGVRVP